MTSFVVMSDRGEGPENDIRFVRDGFSVLGFALPVVWLLWHRLWLHAALCFATFGVIAALVHWSGNPIWIGLSALASALISLLVALEGGEWVRQSLEREGFHEVDVIPARNAAQAEELYAGRMVTATVRKPVQGFAPVSPASLIPLTGNL
jgi:hypothetical protein